MDVSACKCSCGNGGREGEGGKAEEGSEEGEWGGRKRLSISYPS